MLYSELEQRAFYRRQTRRLLELVEVCNDVDTVVVLLRAAIFGKARSRSR
jgi:hypothetical protein